MERFVKILDYSVYAVVILFIYLIFIASYSEDTYYIILAVYLLLCSFFFFVQIIIDENFKFKFLFNYSIYYLCLFNIFIFFRGFYLRDSYIQLIGSTTWLWIWFRYAYGVLQKKTTIIDDQNILDSGELGQKDNNT